MSYTTKEVWLPMDRDNFTGVGNNASTAATTLKSGTSPVARGAICGFHVSVNASSGGSHKAVVDVYENGGTNLVYSTELALNPNTQASDNLSTPIPFFANPVFILTDVAGGGSKNYSVRFCVKAIA